MARAELRRQAGVEPTITHEKDKEAAATTEAAAALDDPGRQFEILHPGSVSYKLRLPQADGTTVEKEISLPNHLSIKDVVQRRALDDLESLATFLRVQVQELAPDEEVDSAFLSAHMGLYEAAILSSGARTLARKIIAKIARVPVAEIEEGMDRMDTVIATMFLFNRMAEELARQKNDRRAATESE